MEIVARLKDPAAYEYIADSGIYFHCQGEPKLRALIVGETFRPHADIPWSDILDGVCLGKFHPVLPAVFKAKVLKVFTLRMDDGTTVTAVPPEIVLVKGTQEIARAIAYRQLEPLDKTIWQPSMLSPEGKMKKMKDDKNWILTGKRKEHQEDDPWRPLKDK